jgi:hypothetical protein
MRQLLLKALVLLGSLGGLAVANPALARDFEVNCPCLVTLPSDSLAQVSFGLARHHTTQDTTALEVLLITRPNYKDFESDAGALISEATVTDLPAIGETRSYTLRLPVRFFDRSFNNTELRVSALDAAGNRQTIAERALTAPLPASADRGFSYRAGALVFTERPTFTRDGDQITIRLPPLTNLSDAPAEDLTVILGQFQPTDFAFFRIGEVALGTLEPGAEQASQPLVGTILSNELASYNGLGLYVVRTAGGRADAPIEDFYLSDYFADLSGAGATYESAFEAQAVRFFFDGDDDGVSDYASAPITTTARPRGPSPWPPS